MVAEAHSGGWSGTFRKVVDNMALRQGSAGSEWVEPASLRIAQRLSICIHAENARAVLKRLPSVEVETVAEEEAAWDHESEEGQA